MTPTEAELLAAETAVWEALRAGDRAADRALLAPDFLGVYPTGFVDRDDHVAELDEGPIVAEFDILETRTMATGQDSALIAYRVRFRPTADGEPLEWMVSSIWRREPDGSLVNTFSQDTPVERGSGEGSSEG
ncbi:nuclear transport factor 2 family protein [Nostocoides sp. F2B08]|uniref:nuclear transport factor 2 family protein n=1 Tax=Nostocoides sp. F2B08 TaxID=2653936 RepID=UPI001D044497|nr:nuclear transport factor 2 family protein [Tetrasphaera sp. F2B08]